MKRLVWLLAAVLALECGYCVAAFTDWVPPLARLRQTYIETALNTMSHKWLATAFFPGDVVQQVYAGMVSDRQEQLGLNSSDWTVSTRPTEAEERKGFFALFPELEEAQVEVWAQAHPEALAQGWSEFYVNQAGSEDTGTELYTRQGDQVLAIDAANGLLVLRVREAKYRGVLILGKDPARLSCAAAADWGVQGQTAGDIAQGQGALVALTASGFDDGFPEGTAQTGAAMCQGTAYGAHLKPGYKRLELRSDDRLYVTDAPEDFHPDCTDASEWTPALIVDGVTVVSQDDHYNARNPRCCLGQAKDGTILMLCIEGRYLDSLGATAPECAEILERYGCFQAMNLDGGTSAICWYEGQYITRCSDPEKPQGRKLPNAWVYQ